MSTMSQQPPHNESIALVEMSSQTAKVESAGISTEDDTENISPPLGDATNQELCFQNSVPCRVWLIITFFVFNVGLPALDILSDIWAGIEHIQKGRNWCGFITIFLIITPYIVKILFAFITHARLVSLDSRLTSNEKWKSILVLRMSGICLLLNHFPLFIIIRNLRLLLGLILMDTNLIQNKPVIRDIQNKVASAKLFEAFLESAPQFVFQCSIILRTGNYSSLQLSSILISSLQSSKFFYMMRMGIISDPDPTIKMVLSIFPIVLFMTFGYLSSLVFVATYLNYGFFFYLFLCFLIIVLVIKFNKANKRDMKTLYTSFHFNDVKNLQIFEEHYDQLSWYTIVTSIFSPLSVWSNNFRMKSKLPFKVMIIVTVLHLISVLFVTFVYPSNDSLMLEENPPIFHCFSNHSHFNSTHYRFVTVDSNNSFFQIFQKVDKENSKPAIRFCSAEELPYYTPGLIVILLIIVSSASSYLLFWLGNYYNLYKFSQYFCCCCDPIIHQNLLIDVNENDEKRKTEKLKHLIKEHGKAAKDSNTSCETFMHKCARKNKLVKLCSLNLIGGQWASKNGDDEDVIQVVYKNFVTNPKIFDELSCINKYQLMHATDTEGNTLLNLASKDEQFVLIEKLVELKSDINAKDKNEQTLLHIAALNGTVELIEKVIQLGASVNIKDKYGRTPLHIAARSGNFETNLKTIEKLIQLGADVNAKDNTRQTYPYLKAENGIYVKGSSDLKTNTNSGQTLLHMVVLHENFFHMGQQGPSYIAALDKVVVLIERLVALGANVNAKNKDGQTPLHNAAWMGDVKSIEKLIELGAEVNAKDDYGETPFHHVFKSRNIGNIESIEKLFELGSDVEAKKNDGQTPLHWTGLNNEIVLLEKLIQLGANVNAKNNWAQTPLHFAAMLGQIEFIEKLNHFDVDLHARDDNGRTALHYEPLHGQFIAIKKLIELGCDINAKDNNGETPLHSAAKNGNYNWIGKLIELGADVNVKCKKGRTPLHLVDPPQRKFISIAKLCDLLKNDQTQLTKKRKQKKVESIRKLIESGADVNAKDDEGNIPRIKSKK